MKGTIRHNVNGKSIIKATFFCVAFTVLFILFSIAKSFLPAHLERLSHGVLGTLAALLTTTLFLHVDRRPFSAIGLSVERKTVLRFLTGVVIGIVLMGLLAASVLYVSDVTIERNPQSSLLHFLVATLPLLPLAWMEELGFRAYPLRTLKEKTGIRPAIFLTSLLFALYHLANGWSVASSFLGPGIWGLVFGLAAVYSNGIAMPTGIHYAANLTTSAFGAAAHPFCLWTIKQPQKVTAKEGGVDWATVLPALALLVFAVLCLVLYRKQNAAGKPQDF